MDRNCLKTVYGESVLTQIAKIKMTGSIIGPVGKKIKKKKKKKKITGSIIGPAMAGPTGPSATVLSSVVQLHFELELSIGTLRRSGSASRNCGKSHFEQGKFV